MLLDLGSVTRTLLNVIRQTVPFSPVWPPAQQLQMLPHPPDRLVGDATIGLYLYHVSEDAAFKNRPPPPGNEELRFTPMALQLHYVLSAHADINDNDGGTSTFREQLMMGLAVKGLRDHPMLDDATQINGSSILDPAIQGAENRIRIYLQPVPANEAVSYWTAGSSPLRLSAYYQAAVILLEPDKPPALSGRVLRYGIQTFVSGAPHLDDTHSTISFLLPGEQAVRNVIAQPAQAAIGDELAFTGFNLTAGVPTLLVRGATWAESIEVDASWGLVVTAEGGFARVQAAAGGQAILPGVYSAFVRVTKTITLPDGSTRDIAQTSNAAPFMVAPGVTTIGPINTAGHLTVTGTGYAPPEAVEVFLGSTKLAVAASPPALQPSEFTIVSPEQIDLRVPAALATGQVVSLRLIVNGVESAPKWVVVP